MCLNNGVYKYVVVYVDVLLIAVQDLSCITKALSDKQQFNLKGAGPLQYSLGCDYFLTEA
jgi:hypothetical protein